MNEKVKKGRGLAFGLGGLQVFIGLGGVSGGFGLVTEPSGANLGFHVDLLSKSPFSDYLIPGLILLIIIGLGSLVGVFCPCYGIDMPVKSLPYQALS